KYCSVPFVVEPLGIAEPSWRSTSAPGLRQTYDGAASQHLHIPHPPSHIPHPAVSPAIIAILMPQSSHNTPIPAFIMLADGYIARGRLIGKPGTTLGKLVFNTSMMGYQEILTD